MGQGFTFDAYQLRFVKIALVALGTIAVGLVAITISTAAPTSVITVLVLATAILAGAAVLAMRDQARAGLAVGVYGLFALCVGALFGSALSPSWERYAVAPLHMLPPLAVLSALLMPVRWNLLFGGVSIATLIGAAITDALGTVGASIGIGGVVGYVIVWSLATGIGYHYMQLARKLVEFDGVVDRARRIAVGDLSGDVGLQGDSSVSRVISDMLVGLRGIVQEVQESVRVLGATTTNISSMATEQQRGAVHQSSAVAQTRETIQSLATSSHKITEAAEGVLRNARSAQQTNERANEQLNALAAHTRRIDELLEFVKDIASKSEILALNAALEGTKAGEAGRGFSLVAAQMRRLAESTANAIKDVKELTSDITRSTTATVISMEEATKLARDTTLAAQQISLITQQQSSSAEQVLEAMSDIATVTTEFADGTKDALSAIVELKTLTERFTKVAHRFIL